MCPLNLQGFKDSPAWVNIVANAAVLIHMVRLGGGKGNGYPGAEKPRQQAREAGGLRLRNSKMYVAAADTLAALAHHGARTCHHFVCLLPCRYRHGRFTHSPCFRPLRTYSLASGPRCSFRGPPRSLSCGWPTGEDLVGRRQWPQLSLSGARVGCSWRPV